MDTIKFYKELPVMECFQGDTLPKFSVSVEDADNCTMLMILEDLKFPGSIQIERTCTKTVSEEAVIFSTQLTSEDTKTLIGNYRMHFILTDENQLEYKKIAGLLKFNQIAQRGES